MVFSSVSKSVNWSVTQYQSRFGHRRQTCRQHSSTGSKINAVDLRRRQLTALVLENRSLPGIQAAVQQAAETLIASADWQQLQGVFASAAAQPGGAATAVPKTAQRSAGASPWGFALRQPSRSQFAAGADVSPLLPQVQRPQKQQALQWSQVQQLTILGLGSIHNLLAQGNSQQTQSAAPSRLGFRLMQLSLAVALQQKILPGLTRKPTAFDPEFEPADIELLDRLGFTVPPIEPSLTVTGPTLLYMPCCPRQLYSDVLTANWPQLQQIAILGTSMSSLSNTQSLFSALVNESEGAAAASTAAQDLRAGQLQDAPQQQQQQQQQQTDMVSVAFKKGHVVELPCPDCSAHGVGVSLHMFK